MKAKNSTNTDETVLVSATELAGWLGITRRRVSQIAEEGIIKPAQESPMRFDLKETVRAYVKHLAARAAGRVGKSMSEQEAAKAKLVAEADLKQSKAEIARMELDEIKGRLHRSEDVEAMTNALALNVRSAVLALPGRLAMDLVPMTSASEVSARIKTECDAVLNDLSRYHYDRGEYMKRSRARIGWESDLSSDDEEDDDE